MRAISIIAVVVMFLLTLSMFAVCLLPLVQATQDSGNPDPCNYVNISNNTSGDPTYSSDNGSVGFVDPGGYIYDSVTLQKIANALVWLQQPDGLGGWRNVSTGQIPAVMQPDINPQISNSSGGYQWNTLDGSYRVHVEALGYFANDTDITVPPQVNNLNIALTRSDTTPPTGSIVINSNATYTNSTSVTLNLTYSDIGSAVSQVRYSNDGVWDSEVWESASASKTWTLTFGDGTKTVYYQIKDIVALTSISYNDTIVLDTTSPTGSIIINSGDTYTNLSSVTLTLTYSDLGSGVSQVRYSNDGTWDTEVWESPSANNAWFLTSGDGTKTVYYQIKNNALLTSITYSDTIIMDTTPPTGSITINSGATATTSTSVTLTLTYSDTVSGISQVRYSNDGVWDTEVWESASASKAWTLTSGDGTKTVYYQIKNNALLTSITYSDTIIMDTTPPTGSITINSGATATTSTSVTLTLTYSDTVSGISQVRYSNDGVWDTEVWESASASKAWTLTSGDGTKTVYYQIKNNAALTSDTYDSIDLIPVTPTPIPPTPTPVPVPNPVTLSKPTNPSAYSLHLSWTQNYAQDFYSYEIYVSQNSGLIGYLTGTIYDSSVTSYDATGLTYNTTYYFTIRTNTFSSLYADSNQVFGKTSPPPVTKVPLDYPYNPTASTVSLTWQYQSNPDFQKYDIFVSLYPGSLGSFIGTVSNQYTTSYEVTNLNPSTNYYFTVRTVNIWGDFADSNQVYVTTSPPDPIPPTLVMPITIIGMVLGLIIFVGLASFAIKRQKKKPKKQPPKPVYRPPPPPVYRPPTPSAGTIQCQKCGHNNPEKFEFCGRCGARLRDGETRIY